MSVIEQARAEMIRANFNVTDMTVMNQILELFFEQWDSGGAVAAMAPVLQRLIAAKPLSPLTGADDEWFQPMDDMEVYQNRRCGSVFKERDTNGDWITYDIGRPPSGVPADVQLKHRWAACEIKFPYEPGSEVGDPLLITDADIMMDAD